MPISAPIEFAICLQLGSRSDGNTCVPSVRPRAFAPFSVEQPKKVCRQGRLQFRTCRARSVYTCWATRRLLPMLLSRTRRTGYAPISSNSHSCSPALRAVPGLDLMGISAALDLRYVTSPPELCRPDSAVASTPRSRCDSTSSEPPSRSCIGC